MFNNVLFRTYRKRFPGTDITLLHDEAPNLFSCHHVKPLTKEQIRAGYAIIEMESERQRRRRCESTGTIMAEPQEPLQRPTRHTFLSVLDEEISLVKDTDIRRSDYGFVLALRERASHLIGSEELSLDTIRKLTTLMILKEGWRMGALDRHIINSACSLTALEESNLAQEERDSSRHDGDGSLKVGSAAADYS